MPRTHLDTAVRAIEFADLAKREAWRRERGMVVFSLWDSTNTRPSVDIFAESPVEFETLMRDAVSVTLAGMIVRVASVPHLIEMKQQAGRPKDLADIELLRAPSAKGNS